MFNLGPEKLMMVLLVALIVLGPDKLPNAARQVGRYLNEFRRISQSFQSELRSAIDLADMAKIDTETGSVDPDPTVATPVPTDDAAPRPDAAPTPDPAPSTAPNTNGATPSASAPPTEATVQDASPPPEPTPELDTNRPAPA